MKAHLSIAVFVVACGGSSSTPPGDDDTTPDAPVQVFHDAPSTLPANITVSGQASETGFSGTTPVAGVAVAAFANADENTPLATATTDAQGNYSFMIDLNGAPWDGYIKATKSGYVDLYFYATGALATNFDQAGFNMITPGNMNALSNIANGEQSADKGLVGLGVLDASGQPVAGATVSSMPESAHYRYMESNGFPSSSATATAADGVAFMFNAPPGAMITISAMKSGMTFVSHTIKARPGVFTSTAITP